MKRKLTEDVLNQIRDEYIEKAAFPKKKARIPWLRTAAAALALVLVTALLLPSGSNPPVVTPTAPTQSGIPQGTNTPGSNTHAVYTLSAAQYPPHHPYPLDGNDMDAYDLWRADRKALRNHPDGYVDNLQSYFSESVPMLLNAEPGKNAVCSPLNIYMALAMLAEITDGSSRQQILDLLEANNINTLRTQAGQVWKAHYYNDGLSTSILGSSLWLDKDYTCNQKTAELLAEAYFASVFTGDLGTEEMDQALQGWLSKQTGGLLDDYIQNVHMDPLTTLALASTIHYQVQWTAEFWEKNNIDGIFHGADNRQNVTFMCTTLPYGPYYWSEHFGAIRLGLEDYSTMWLFLPDQGTTPEELLSSGEIFEFLYTAENQKQQKNLMVNLQLPKFDISGQQDLVRQMQALGVTDIFQSGVADFSPIIEEKDGGFVSEIQHAARVGIDEKGVTAAAYTLILRAGAGMPPSEEMDFILDRPFVFVIESQDGLPLFAGTVYEP